MRLFVAGLILLAAPRLALGCLFCEALAGTLSDDIRESAACVIARLDADANREPVGTGMQLAEFRITKVLKGTGFSEGRVNAYILPEEPPEGSVLLFAFGEAEDIQWSAPLPLDRIAVKYLDTLQSAPASGSDRLAHFLPYLVADDRHVADDAYNEFARSPYPEIRGLGDRLDRRWVLKHLNAYLADDRTPPHRVRLMWTLLSVCGTAEDAVLFDQLAKDESIDRNQVGFDAALGCYLALIGREGLERVKHEFLHSDDDQEVFAALNAIRFHAVETKQFDQASLSDALHPMLRNVRLAAYVIPDLARMEDWTIGPRLLDLYGREDAGSIRVHIVNYLRACPNPEAEAWLNDCRRIDPAAVRRSELMFGHIGKPATP